jgi:hypothetical protein
MSELVWNWEKIEKKMIFRAGIRTFPKTPKRTISGVLKSRDPIQGVPKKRGHFLKNLAIASA